MKYLISFVVMILSLSLSGFGAASLAADFDWMKNEDSSEKELKTRKFDKQYILFRGGGFFPDKFNIGGGAEAGYGIQPLRFLAAEASFGFIEADDYDDNMLNEHTTVQFVPVTGTIRAILPFKQFDVYALAGAGMYYTMLKIDNKNQGSSSIDSDKVLLGYHYGGGASLLLGGVSSLGLEVKCIDTSWDDLDFSGTLLTFFFRMAM